MRAEEEYETTCPHCWQPLRVLLDPSAGSQQYIQDCEVCCNPIEISFDVHGGEIRRFEARSIEQ